MRRWMKDWNALNPILADGEVGEIIGMVDTKTGDGKTPWRDLRYTGTFPEYAGTSASPAPCWFGDGGDGAWTDDEWTATLSPVTDGMTAGTDVVIGDTSMTLDVVETGTYDLALVVKATGTSGYVQASVALNDDSVGPLYLDWDAAFASTPAARCRVTFLGVPLTAGDSLRLVVIRDGAPAEASSLLFMAVRR